MRRIVSVFLSILLGALAVGVGMGIYLHKANQDRERLAQLATAAENMVASIQEKQDRAILEANKKLEDANIEVAKAQIALKTLEEERKLMASATPLQAPKPAQIKGWKDAIHLQMGISLKYPAATSKPTFETNAFTLERTSGDSEASADNRWFSLVPWDDRLEEELLSTFTTSTAVSYLSQGHLFIGHIGTMANTKSSIFVLKARTGSTNFLLWARDPDTLAEHKTILQVLSTLDFEP